jgi:2-methylcitrate dehydratase PrpD
MDKYAPAGWTSLAEVAAVKLAEIGYTGDTTVLDGDYGFWKFYGGKGWQPQAVLQGLGDDWQFLEMSYKPYPCCRIMQGALDCFIEIIEENHLMPEDIEQVMALLNPLFTTPVFKDTQRIRTHIDVQFSLPYIFSVAAHGIPIADWQEPDTMKAPQILEFMEKVRFDAHPEFSKVALQNPKHRLSSAEVVAKGQTFRKEKIWAKGDSFLEEARMKDEELEAKFRANALRVVSQTDIDKAVKAIFELEKIGDVSELLAFLSS